MKNLDRFRSVMHYVPCDHPPYMGEGPWPDTVERWNREGLAPGRSWTEALGVETFNIDHHGYRDGIYPLFESRVIEETDEFRVVCDEYGCTTRNFKHSTSMPEWLEFPVTDRASFERLIAEHMDPRPAVRLPADWAARVCRFNHPDFDGLLLPPAGSFCAVLKSVMSVETMCLLFYDAPDLMRRFFDLQSDLCCWFLEKFFAEVQANVFCIGTGEDLAFKNGPFFSPAMFEEFFAPGYSRAVAIARRHGAELFFMDTDGNFSILLPRLLEIGVNLFNPMEVAAGMDPVALRTKHGQALRMIGGVDKRIVAAGPDAIRAELRRLEPVVRAGGYCPKIDHSISADISWDNFRCYIDALRDLFGRLGR